MLLSLLSAQPMDSPLQALDHVHQSLSPRLQAFCTSFSQSGMLFLFHMAFLLSLTGLLPAPSALARSLPRKAFLSGNRPRGSLQSPLSESACPEHRSSRPHAPRLSPECFPPRHHLPSRLLVHFVYSPFLLQENVSPMRQEFAVSPVPGMASGMSEGLTLC